MDLPVGKALSAASQEDAYRVVGTNDTPPEFEEAFHEFHCLDVGHGAQDRATKAFTRGQRLATARLRLQSLGHTHLQRDRRQPARELDPVGPLPGALDR